MRKAIKTKDLFTCSVPYLKTLFNSHTYPWEIIPKIKEHIENIIEKGLDGFTETSKGVWVGENVNIHSSAVIVPPDIIKSELS